ncbi:hypothetical protein [Streptomyces beijiangensis]|uniref:Nucleopolyhedrovirus P10 family protein n=1 Tax=Streptomyces beijiangensis TaxID=163361 RepID=A0A939FB26_9ACTN|nr:hypothetical protein [Streptomyces beijiangensis]MBO0513765.1 hypothetical protein [Streptomyces beijiangensis]
MTDSWTKAVRNRLGLGRLLPLGGAADSAWLTERAASAVLRAAAAGVPGVVTGALRLTLDDPDTAVSPEVAMVPSALPVGPLRIEAEAEVLVGEVLPVAVGHLRDALFAAAERVGLVIAAVDLRVTGLAEAEAGPGAAAEAPGAAAVSGPVAERAAAVPGVAYLTGVLGAPVQTAEDHVRVEIAVAAGYRALDVACAVRVAVGGELPVGVLVTAVGFR